MKNILNIAHRGAGEYEHENTAASIKKAIEMGADAVEFDLRRTADGAIVLWHDECIRNRAGKSIPLSRIPLDDLYLYSRNKGFRVAVFEEILKEFRAKIAFDIEIKTPGFEEDIVHLLKQFPPEKQPMISSFHPPVIRRIKALDPSIKTGLVIGNGPLLKIGIKSSAIFRRYLSRAKANSAHLNLKIASKVIINELTESGFEIYIWTVNNEKDMKYFLALDVDGIITDKPDLLNTVKRTAIDMSLNL